MWQTTTEQNRVSYFAPRFYVIYWAINLARREEKDTSTEKRSLPTVCKRMCIWSFLWWFRLLGSSLEPGAFCDIFSCLSLIRPKIIRIWLLLQLLLLLRMKISNKRELINWIANRTRRKKNNKTSTHASYSSPLLSSSYRYKIFSWHKSYNRKPNRYNHAVFPLNSGFNTETT